MTPEEFDKLSRGDIVIHNSSGSSYVIERTHYTIHGKECTGVLTINITNPNEWTRLEKK